MRPAKSVSINKQLSSQGHSVTTIDQSQRIKINDTQDAKVIVGELHCCLRKLLKMQT